jgi:hypothetical protein
MEVTKLESRQPSYLFQMSDMLKAWDQKLETLQKKGTDTVAEVRSDWHRITADLRQERLRVDHDVERLKGASGESLRDLKQSFARAWRDLSNGYQKAVTSLKS